MTKILAVAAVLAMSPSARAVEDGDGACSYAFDVTHAMEAAPSGCPVAIWYGGGYDAIHMQSIPASEPAPAPAPAYLAQLWSVP